MRSVDQWTKLTLGGLDLIPPPTRPPPKERLGPHPPCIGSPTTPTSECQGNGKVSPPLPTCRPYNHSLPRVPPHDLLWCQIAIFLYL